MSKLMFSVVKIVEFIEFRANYYYFFGSKLLELKFNGSKLPELMFSGVKIIEFIEFRTNY